MLKIGIISPEKGFYNSVFPIFQEHNQKYLNNRCLIQTDYVLEEIVVDPFNFHGIKTDVDAIILKSGYMSLLKQIDETIPLIEIDLPGFDVIRHLLECKRIFGEEKVGLSLVRNMFIDVDYIESIVGIPIQAFYLDSISNSAEMVELALENGCKVILGHYYTCKYAKSRDIKHIKVTNSKATYWQAITEAKMAAQFSYLSQERAGKLNTILDYAHEGILFLNNNMQVNSINSKALKMLNLESEKNILNKRFTAQIAGSEIYELILNNREYNNKIIKINNTELTLNKAFIALKGRATGILITLQKINSIEKLEGEIRKQIYGKGHVAKAHFQDIVGESENLKRMITKACRFSQTKSNILIYGESGTGKEILAQSIHNNSQRKDGPFVAINCAALPEHLLESELFGYEEGAFTGASKKGKPGLFELAHRGSIFLDEIGEMPLALQAKILRVIQEREVSRLGGVKVIPLDVRLISATNQDLKQLIKEGRFREDLYYRLNVLSIQIPPLNHRREDIPLLVQYFFEHNFGVLSITKEARSLLQAYDWNGNVRQLFNICEQLGVLCDGSLVSEMDVQEVLYPEKDYIYTGRKDEVEYPFIEKAYEEERNKGKSSKNTISEELSEKDRIIDVLVSVRYSRDKAARILGIDRSTLWRKMKKYRII